MGAQIATAIVAVGGKGSCTWWTRYCTNNHENAQPLPATGPMGYRRAPWRAACTARASLATLDHSWGKPRVPDYHAAMIDTLPLATDEVSARRASVTRFFAFHFAFSPISTGGGLWGVGTLMIFKTRSGAS
jgi:hypothetical protein